MSSTANYLRKFLERNLENDDDDNDLNKTTNDLENLIKKEMLEYSQKRQKKSESSLQAKIEKLEVEYIYIFFFRNILSKFI
jgi:hypothetical protein